MNRPRNRQFRLARRPEGMPDADDWERAEEAVPEPDEGQVLVRSLYLSLDPAMRTWMNPGRSYIDPVGIGEVMRALGIGRVERSRHPEIAEGSHVAGRLGIQDYACLPGDELEAVDADLAPLPRHLGVLGIPGLTAYFGLMDVGELSAGQTVVVSAAAGAVGSVAGQIARLHDCRVVGIAGGEDKCRHIVADLGFDAAIDHRSEDLRRSLKEHCPEGLDIYFDNVGGEVLEAALSRLRRRARVVICGAVSQYNNTEGMQGPSNYMNLLVQRARMEGFVVFDYAARYAEARRQMAEWLREGRLQGLEHIVTGLDTFPETLRMLYTGANTGKLVLAVDDPT